MVMEQSWETVFEKVWSPCFLTQAFYFDMLKLFFAVEMYPV